MLVSLKYCHKLFNVLYQLLAGSNPVTRLGTMSLEKNQGAPVPLLNGGMQEHSKSRVATR